MTESSIRIVIAEEAKKLGISEEELGKFGDLLAASLYSVITSRDFVRFIENQIAKESKDRARGYGL